MHQKPNCAKGDNAPSICINFEFLQLESAHAMQDTGYNLHAYHAYNKPSVIFLEEQETIIVVTFAELR